MDKTWQECLELVVFRTKHERYRELCADSHPHHLIWRQRVMALAGVEVPEVKAVVKKPVIAQPVAARPRGGCGGCGGKMDAEKRKAELIEMMKRKSEREKHKEM